MKNGILVLYKESGMTSHDAVNIIRKLYKTKKVGHTGTLDPEAVGILPILIGNAVKASEYVIGDKKKYRASIKFGIFTDTEDIWGNITESSEMRCEKSDLEKALASFIGKYMQIPPMMSAVKIGGKKLYELYREGKSVERKARECRIYSADLTGFDENGAEIELECSKGTYVRTFIFDLMHSVGIMGCMSALERLESAGFTKNDSVTIKELEELDEIGRERFILPTEKYFKDKRKVKLEPFFYKLIKNGCSVNIKKMALQLEKDEIVRLYFEDKFFGLGKAIGFEEGLELKKIKEFE